MSMHHQSIHYLEFPVSSFIFENSGQQISNQRGSERRGNYFKRLLLVLCTMISTIISIAMVTPALFLVFTLILAHHTYFNMRGSNFRLRGSCLPKKQGEYTGKKLLDFVLILVEIHLPENIAAVAVGLVVVVQCSFPSLTK